MKEAQRVVLPLVALTLAQCLSLVLLVDTWPNHVLYQTVEWFSFSTTTAHQSFQFGYYVNNMSAIMLNVVVFISLLVHVFSIEYMKHKRNHALYFPYLSLFTLAMVLIVVSSSLITVFLGWELVGFASFLLIGFWFHKWSAAQAALKAFLINRFSDLFFVGAIVLIYVHFHTLDIAELYALKNQIAQHQSLWIIGLLFFIGCMAKMGQFPFSTWLPDAMQGPTPVSALLHAATMVAAGVFLLVKLNFLLSTDIKNIMAFVGVITAFLGALPALFTFDSKKVLAYSTISQLGYMVAAIGCSASDAGYFHLLTHAFFKAGLFLSVGAVIHTIHHLQEHLAHQGNYTIYDTMSMKLMGGMRKYQKTMFVLYIVCAAALIGLPFTSGFLSKESIVNEMLHIAMVKQGIYWVIPGLGLTTVFITAFYVTRQAVLIFGGEHQLLQVHQIKEQDLQHSAHGYQVFNIPVLLLSICSLFLLFSWNPFSSHHSWVNAIGGIIEYTGHHSWGVMAASLSCIAMGVGISYKRYSTVSIHDLPTNDFVSSYYGVDIAIHKVVKATQVLANALAYFDKRVLDRCIHFKVYFIVVLGNVLAWFDRYLIDGLIVVLVFVTSRVGRLFRLFQRGNVQNYLFWTMFVLLLIVFIMMIKYNLK
jgi:NADH-quinone oxidoreductase subunit L